MERKGVVEEIPASLLHRAHRPIYAWSWKDDLPFQMDLFPHVQDSVTMCPKFATPTPSLV